MIYNLKKIVLTIFFLFLSSSVSLAKPQNKTVIPVKVGVILGDLEHSVTEEIWLSCIKLAISDFYASHAHYKTRLVLNIRESKHNIVAAAAKGNFTSVLHIMNDTLIARRLDQPF